MLDIIAENNWKRPIYFSGGAFNNEDYIWMKDYLQLDGMVYKLVPVKTPAKDKYTFGMIDTEKMMQKLEKWTFIDSCYLWGMISHQKYVFSLNMS